MFFYNPPMIKWRISTFINKAPHLAVIHTWQLLPLSDRGISESCFNRKHNKKHFLDEALEIAVEEGEMTPECAHKCRAIFRAIYSKASGCVRVTASDGEQMNSDRFPLRRGVVQGEYRYILTSVLHNCTHSAAQ